PRRERSMVKRKVPANVGRLIACWQAVVAGLACAVGLFAGGAAAASAASFAYVANSGSNSVSAFSIGPGGGLSAVQGSPFVAGTEPVAVAVSPDRAQLYVANSGSNSVSAFSIGPGGGLSA